MRTWLRELRQKRNMASGEAAKAIGLSAAAYSQLETGKRQKKMKADTILRLAAVFAVEPEYILEKEAEYMEQ